MAKVYPAWVREDILRMIPPDGRIVGSIGCGVGSTEAVLVKKGYEVHGVDIEPEAVEIAAKNLTTARVIAPDDLHPFAPESLDGLILADVIEHIPRAWEALCEFTRAVRPGGWVVISVPNMRSLEVLHEFMWKGDWPERETGIFDATHIQMMSKKRLKRWIAAAGLEAERWFDLYDPNGPRRSRFFRTLDAVTFRLIHSWCMYQLQVQCRKRG